MYKIIKTLIPVLFVIFSFMSTKEAFACSTFCIQDKENIVFGRNYDWYIGYGYFLTNHKNIQKTRYLSSSEPAISWTSKYGSVTFNQYGKEFPAGGMNDKGLVVETLLQNNTSVYPNIDKRKELDVLGWVQYQLDTSSSIYDLIKSDKKLRITSKPMALIHFLITDAKGNTLVVEYINGEAVFFHGENLKL